MLMRKFSWLLLMDLDGTMWDHKDISKLNPPFKKVREDVISDLNGVLVKLNKDMLKLLIWARDNGALISTLSWNIPEKALNALEAFGIIGYFDYLVIEDTDRKDTMIIKLLKRIEEDLGIRFNIDKIVYIDDLTIHINDIYKNIGKIKFYQIGVDFNDFEEAKDIISKALKL